MSLYLSKNDDKNLDSQNLHIPYLSSKLSLPRKFELATIHGFVLLSPHISQVITPIICLTHIKSCWGNFESKIFYLGSISPLCGRHSHPIIVNLYCNIFNKIQPSSSPSWIHSFERRFHSHGRSLIVIEKNSFWKIHLWGKKLLGEKHSKSISSNR